MKLIFGSNLLLALCLNGKCWQSNAFFGTSPTATGVRPQTLLLKSSLSAFSEAGDLAVSQLAFPSDMELVRMEGGNTVRTWKIPHEAERAQIYIETNGRPLKATVQLWIGPIRTVHTMKINSQNGSISPYRSMIKFKKASPTLRIITSEDQQLPIWAGVRVPNPEDNDKIAAFTDKVWDSATKTRIQGGPIEGGNGAVRTFPIDVSVDAVQVICWSKDTSRKSLKAKIEILQGPNNYKQEYDLQCGGGTQPFQAVFPTPGDGWTIRVYNKKYIEDGLFEIAVVPFVVDGKSVMEQPFIPSAVIQYPKEGTRIGPMPSGKRTKQWWE